MSSDNLNTFLNQLMNLGGSTFTLMGTKRPGMSGASEFGGGNDTTGQLKQNVMRFAEAYRNPATDERALQAFQALADQVEGALFTEQALSTFTDSELERLIDVLHDLIASRSV